MIRNNVNLKQEVINGWTVGDFVRVMLPEADAIMQGRGTRAPFKSKSDFAKWCKQHQPHTDKEIPELIVYFTVRYNLT